MITRNVLIALGAAGALVLSANAGDPNSLDRAVYEGLRDVINHGAKVFNEQGDYHGCVRVYQGGLLAVRPLLAHRPDVQKAIDEGLARADALPRAIDRAFALRQVLDQVRERTRIQPPPPPVDKPPKPPEKKPDEKPKKQAQKKSLPKKIAEKKEEKKQPPALQASGIVHGLVTLDGKPVVSGYITFVDKKTQRVYSTYLRADGDYHFRHPLPPGSYTVWFGPAPAEPGVAAKPFNVPQAFRNPQTSPLAAELRPGENVLDFNLK